MPDLRAPPLGDDATTDHSPGGAGSRPPRSGCRRRLIDAGILLATLLVAPRWLCDRGSAAHFRGDAAAVRPLARQVAAFATGGRSASWATRPSRTLRDDERRYASYQLSALGLLQVVKAHPEQRAELLPAARRCVEVLLSSEVRAPHRRAWGVDPLDDLGGAKGQVGYLGYLNLVLALLRAVDPETPYRALNDRVTEALARRLAASPIGLIETYPGMAFPVDCAAAIGSFGVYDRVTGDDHRALIQAWIANSRRRYVDPRTGLLYQQVHPRTGRPVDPARASGTALALYFLGFADPAFARELYVALRRQYRDLAGFAHVREYAGAPPGDQRFGSGDLLFGFGLLATGFTIAGARQHDDEHAYRALYRTTSLLGAPLTRRGRRRYVCGGPLGDAMLLAMLTAEPLEGGGDG